MTIRSSRWTCVLTLVVATVLVPAAVWTEGALAVGDAAEGTLAPATASAFTLTAGEARYLRLRLEQKGADLALRLRSPGGTLVREVDGPGGRWVEELLSVVTSEAGTYTVEVVARAGGAVAGEKPQYRLVFEELRATTAGDAERLRADVLHHQGRHLRQLPSREQRLAALDAFRQAAGLYGRAADARGEADALDQAGGVHLALGKVEVAQSYFRRALPLYQAAGHRPGLADVENDLGITLSRLGEGKEAGEHFRRALAIWRELGDLRGQSIATESMGMLHYRLAELPAARARFEESLELSRAAGDLPGQISTLNSLAVVDRQMGELTRGLEGYRRALAIVRETGDRDQEPRILYNMAAAHRALGELQGALEGYRRALPVARQLGQRDVEEKVLLELAETYRGLGQPEDALTMLTGARERGGGAGRQEAWTLVKTGWVLSDLERPAEAREHFQRALELSHAAEDRRIELQSLLGLTWSLRAEGRLAEARRRQREALAVSRVLGDRITEGDALRGAGEIELAAGRPEPAVELLRQALEANRELAHPTREAMIRGNLAHALRSLGRLEEARLEVEKALDKIDEVREAVVSPELRASFRAARFRDHELHLTLLMELDAARSERAPGDRALREAAFVASERSRARVLVELLAEAGAGARSGLDPELAAREREASRRLSGIQTRLIEELSSGRRREPRLELLRRNLQAARAERERLAEEIRRRHPRYADLRYPRPLGVPEIQSLLDAGTAFLEYALGEERSFLFVLTHEDFSVHEIVPAPAVAASVEQFRQAAAQGPGRRLRGRLNQAARTLHDQLIMPAAASLEGVRNLLIVPDRELHHLPFEALQAEDGHLVTRYAVSYVPSASVLASLSSQHQAAGEPSARHFVGFAQPLDAAVPATVSTDVPTRGAGLFESWSWRPLPGAADEVRSIARLFPGASTTRIGAAAGEDAFKNDPAVAGARILHVAAHGLVDDREPAYSGLLLGASPGSVEDGLLQVHEIFNLRLDAELVVLSACETALGQRLRGEGILGLSRAFFYAGSRSLVVSLWPAADAATSELMRAFYRHLQGGRSKAEALTAAKRELLAHGGTSHPFYWAPFVLVGQP